MAPATKVEAIAKLDSLKVGIGYAIPGAATKGFGTKPDDLFGNLWLDGLFEYHYALSASASLPFMPGGP